MIFKCFVEIREFGGISKGVESNYSFFLVGEVGIVDDILKVFFND